MPKKQWLQILLINLVIALIIVSPFLPGPSTLSSFTNTIYTIAQFSSMFLLIAIPMGVLATIRERTKKQKISLFFLLSWTVPVTVFCVSMFGAYPARNYSRKIAILNATAIIQAIEAYYQVHQKYPDQLSDASPQFLSKVPPTGIMGIANYQYEKRENSFAISFSQNVLMGFNKEIVSYDPKHKYSSDDKANQVYSTGKEKWSYYIAD